MRVVANHTQPRPCLGSVCWMHSHVLPSDAIRGGPSAHTSDSCVSTSNGRHYTDDRRTFPRALPHVAHRGMGCRPSRAREGSWCPLAHCRSEDPASPRARSAGGCARDVGTVRHLCRRDDVSASKTLQHTPGGASRGPPKYFDEWRKGPEGGRKNSLVRDFPLQPCQPNSHDTRTHRIRDAERWRQRQNKPLRKFSYAARSREGEFRFGHRHNL